MISRLSMVLLKRAATFSGKHKFATSSVALNSIEMNKEMTLHQQSLPKLPVPPLQGSFEKYLRSVRPLLSEEEYLNTSKIVEDFIAPGGLGVKLYEKLLEKARTTENWLSEWWLNAAYMEFREPVVIYSSPGLVMPINNFNSIDTQLRFAARLVAGALDFKSLIDNQTLKLEKMGGQPLDMSQYFKIFSTCRIPQCPKDILAFYGSEDIKPKHIVVVHNNHVIYNTT